MTQRFQYASMQDRPVLSWPEGKKLAVWVVPNVEHYEFMPGFKSIRDPWPRSAHPDTLNYPFKEYGNRVGLDRIFEITDRLDIRCTVSLSLAVPTMFPDLFADMVKRRWDFMCHGLYNTHYLWGYPPEREREFIFECKRKMDEVTGKREHGWFSPACSHTIHTADIVAQAGYQYYADLYHDDQPFPVINDHSDLISIPYSMDVNDVVVHLGGGDGEDFARIMVDQFQTLHRESQHTGLVMCIAFHPYITGQLHRVRAFEQALRYISHHDDVWMATGQEIASWYTTKHLPTVKDWLGEQQP